MRMRDALIPVAAIGLSLAACAEPSATEDGRVAGFDRTIEKTYEEEVWQHVSGYTAPPYDDTVRNVRSQTVEGRCREVYDPLFEEDAYGNITGDEADDSDCWGDWWCSTTEGDDTHCEKSPDRTLYSYDEKTWRPLGKCAVEPRGFEDKAEKPRKDNDCIKVFDALPTKGAKRSESKETFWIRAEIKDDEGKTHYAIVNTPPEIWVDLRRSDCVTVRGPEDEPTNRTFVKACK